MALTNKEARTILGMVARGDDNHHIAAWFGVNQGRIAEVKAGSHGSLEPAPATELPPRGSPGLKGRRIRDAIRKAVEIMENGAPDAVALALPLLKAATEKFDANEA